MKNGFKKKAEDILNDIRNSHFPGTKDLEEVLAGLLSQNEELQTQNEELQAAANNPGESNNLYENLFYDAPAGYILLDEKLNIVRANRAATVMLKCEMNRITGMNFTELLDPDFKNAFFEHVKEVLGSEEIHSAEIKFSYCRNFLDARIQSVKEIDKSTGERRIRTVIFDITERKIIERNLKRFRAAIDSSADNIFLIDFDTKRIIDVNESACINLGFKREEFLKLKPVDFNKNYSDEYIDQLLSEGFNNNTKQDFTLENKHKRRDGTIVDVEVFVKCAFIDDEKIIVAVARDISERKKNQKQLAAYARELKELNNSKDKFLSIISHDLRGPFLGIRGYTQLLLEDYDFMSKEEIKDFLSKIDDSSRDLYTLVDNLLKWSRLELGKIPYEPATFNLSDEIEPIVKLMSGIAAKKEISLKNYINNGAQPYADKLMLISVVQNLLSNAIKFTRSGGEVKLSSFQENGWITIAVEDNGIGLTPEVKEKLFSLDKGYASKGTAGEKGTGFGLLIAREMVVKMGGEIWAESEPGNGSVFSFRIKSSDS
jgi:PAS domain S-box-containing protein